MNEIIGFLEYNGFERFSDKCLYTKRTNITITDTGYEVNFDGVTMYSKDHNIYWLIGVLTYYGLMNKNYNQ